MYSQSKESSQARDNIAMMDSSSGEVSKTPSYMNKNLASNLDLLEMGVGGTDDKIPVEMVEEFSPISPQFNNAQNENFPKSNSSSGSTHSHSTIEDDLTLLDSGNTTSIPKEYLAAGSGSTSATNFAETGACVNEVVQQINIIKTKQSQVGIMAGFRVKCYRIRFINNLLTVIIRNHDKSITDNVHYQDEMLFNDEDHLINVKNIAEMIIKVEDVFYDEFKSKFQDYAVKSIDILKEFDNSALSFALLSGYPLSFKVISNKLINHEELTTYRDIENEKDKVDLFKNILYTRTQENKRTKNVKSIKSEITQSLVCFCKKYTKLDSSHIIACKSKSLFATISDRNEDICSFCTYEFENDSRESMIHIECVKYFFNKGKILGPFNIPQDILVDSIVLISNQERASIQETKAFGKKNKVQVMSSQLITSSPSKINVKRGCKKVILPKKFQGISTECASSSTSGTSNLTTDLEEKEKKASKIYKEMRESIVQLKTMVEDMAKRNEQDQLSLQTNIELQRLQILVLEEKNELLKKKIGQLEEKNIEAGSSNIKVEQEKDKV